jgi:hypothetical protein
LNDRIERIDQSHPEFHDFASFGVIADPVAHPVMLLCLLLDLNTSV